MSLTRLLSEIGDDKLQYQPLGSSVVNLQSRGDQTVDVTFVTKQIKPADIISGVMKTGIVVWVDSNDWKDAAVRINKQATTDDVWRSMLEYALQQDVDDCAVFLQLWNEGCWPEIRRDFPDYNYPGGFPY